MNLDIRKAVLHNVRGNSPSDFHGMVVDAINSQEEKTLPGLGVLFEVMWKNSSSSTREGVLEALSAGVK